MTLPNKHHLRIYTASYSIDSNQACRRLREVHNLQKRYRSAPPDLCCRHRRLVQLHLTPAHAARIDITTGLSQELVFFFSFAEQQPR